MRWIQVVILRIQPVKKVLIAQDIPILAEAQVPSFTNPPDGGSTACRLFTRRRSTESIVNNFSPAIFGNLTLLQCSGQFAWLPQQTKGLGPAWTAAAVTTIVMTAWRMLMKDILASVNIGEFWFSIFFFHCQVYQDYCRHLKMTGTLIPLYTSFRFGAFSTNRSHHPTALFLLLAIIKTLPAVDNA